MVRGVGSSPDPLPGEPTGDRHRGPRRHSGGGAGSRLLDLERTGGHAGSAVVAPLPLPVTDDFVELFRLHYPRLGRALELAGAPRWRAEDLSQEAFARTLRHWRRIRGGINPAGYLYRTAFRLLGRRGLLLETALDDEVVDTAPGPEEQAVTSVDMHRALAAMPARRRACVLLCWWLDVTPADAAESLGIAPGTVRKQLELARRQIRTGAKEGADGPESRPPA